MESATSGESFNWERDCCNNDKSPSDDATHGVDLSMSLLFEDAFSLLFLVDDVDVVCCKFGGEAEGDESPPFPKPSPNDAGILAI